jgi:hypothetical protein
MVRRPGAAGGGGLSGGRLGLREVCYRGTEEVAAKLADIAAQQGGRLHQSLPEALDLAGSPDAAASCRAWLAAGAAGPD